MVSTERSGEGAGYRRKRLKLQLMRCSTTEGETPIRSRDMERNPSIQFCHGPQDHIQQADFMLPLWRSSNPSFSAITTIDTQLLPAEPPKMLHTLPMILSAPGPQPPSPVPLALGFSG